MPEAKEKKAPAPNLIEIRVVVHYITEDAINIKYDPEQSNEQEAIDKAVKYLADDCHVTRVYVEEV